MGDESEDRCGCSAALADVNEDALADVLIGCQLGDLGTGPPTGAVLLFYGG